MKNPRLIFVAGSPASGKTILIKALIKHLSDAFVIFKDDVWDPMLSTHLPGEVGTLNGPQREMDGPQGEFYREHIRDQVYQAMLCLASTNYLLGRTPILEGNYTGAIPHRYFSRIAVPWLGEKGVNPQDVRLLFCYATREEVIRRLKQRGSERDLFKLESQQKLEAYVSKQRFLVDFSSQSLRDAENQQIREDFPNYLLINTSPQVPESKNIKKALEFIAS